jgi:hypothetical protein
MGESAFKETWEYAIVGRDSSQTCLNYNGVKISILTK